MASNARRAPVVEEKLGRGRKSYDAQAWGDAYRLLEAADRESPLGGEDLERLATAAYLIGRELDSDRIRDRAYQRHLSKGDRPRAARSAFWSGLTLLFRGETGQAEAWLARARRLIRGIDCAEQGYVLLPLAERHLEKGRPDAAHAVARRAAEIGDRNEDPDLRACARHLLGRARLLQGSTAAGLALLDEAMLAAAAGELSPIMTGLIYCSLIEACQRVFALNRAREWTAALSCWCDRQTDMVPFTRTCLIRRAEILRLTGEWPEAMAEANRACKPLRRQKVDQAPAAAFYQKAEMHRLRGEFEAAEDAYRTAARLGCEPQPGLALLRATQGRLEAASAAIRRVVGAAVDPLRRAALLPAQIEIMLATGDIPEAQHACRELEEVAAAYATIALHAMAAQASGAVLLAEGHPREALPPLRRAFEAWQEAEAPYEAARVRVLTALACRSLGDEEAAGLEISAARIVFERLEAAPDLARLDQLVAPAPADPARELTRRELEVLQQIVRGKTNRAIANELFLSERTIDRHVSNILCKLDVPTRAAAAAYACRHKLA